MRHARKAVGHPRGFTYLEAQVAMALFMIAIGGAVPLAVMQTRQLARVESRFEPATTQYLIQPEGRWAKKLGAPAILSDQPPEPPVPYEDPYAIITIDDRDTGYDEKNKLWFDWWHFTWSSAYGSDFTLNFPDGVDDVAIWEFEDLKPGKYDILVTYPSFAFANQDAEYKFFLNGKEEGDKKVDQTKPVNGPLVDGVRWKKLDKITVTKKKSKFRVELSDTDAVGYNVIDAMRLEPERPEMFLHDLIAPLDDEFLEVLVHAELPEWEEGEGKGKGKGKGKNKDKDKGKGKDK
jgi:hypothetical protein